MKAFRLQHCATGLIVLLIWFWNAPAWSSDSLQKNLERARVQVDFTRLPPNGGTVLQPDAHYSLGAGDRFTLHLWNEKIHLSYELSVNPQGQILIPRLGVFKVSGLDLNSLEKTIIQRSQHIQRDPLQVHILLKQVRQITVLITGHVKRPGDYRLAWGTSVLDALRHAGGVQNSGSVRQIVLHKKPRVKQTLDLLHFHYRGTRSANPLLRGGEQIHVPALSRRAAILGEVQQPGIYEILPGEQTQDILAWAGGPRTTADPLGLKVWPQGLNRGGKTHLEATTPQRILQDGDVYYLSPRKLKDMEGRVFIHGQIRQAGTARWRSGLTLLDLLQEMGGELPAADLSAVLISRYEKGQRQEIKVDLQAYLQGKNPSGNPELLPGDVVGIPESFWNVRNITELTTLALSTLGIVSVVVNLSQSR